MLSFNQSQYAIEENMTPLSVGLILNRTTSEYVIVEVSVNDGSAKGSSVLIVDVKLRDILLQLVLTMIDQELH